jgi:hypothetical protein
MNFGVFNIEAGTKLPLYMEDAAIPTKEERYGFYGKIRHKYEGRVLHMTPTFKKQFNFSQDQR